MTITEFMENTELINKEVRITNIQNVLYNVRGTITKIKGNKLTIGRGLYIIVDENTNIEIIENEE